MQPGSTGEQVRICARAGDVEQLQELLNSCPSAVASQDWGGFSPLMYACQCGQRGAIELLLKRGADPHCTDADGWTALHVACFNGQVEAVSALLAAGCYGLDIVTRQRTRFGESCRRLARPFPDILKLLPPAHDDDDDDYAWVQYVENEDDGTSDSEDDSLGGESMDTS